MPLRWTQLSVPTSIARRHAIVALAIGSLNRPARAARQVAMIAAASDLKFALDDIGAGFQAATGAQLHIAYGSSGNFFRQIAQGAPFELFMAADENFVLQLADKGLTIDRGVPYAIGRIVLFAPQGASWTPDAQFVGLKQALAEGRLSRFAIPNPEHAPYGRAAKQALQRAGLWQAIEPKLVLGENVAQAAQFATSGSAQGGIFALSLALAPAFAGAGRYATVPAAMHEPLRQSMVLMREAGFTARAFYLHLQQPDARTVFKRYGFVLPGEG